MKTIICAIGLALLSGPSAASCFDEAEKVFQVPKHLLIAIAKVESGFNPHAVHVNPDGTEDIGTMQINSRHLPKLRRYGISRADLFDSCVNIKVGAWVLAGQIERYGKTWRAVGAYNAGVGKHGDERARKEYIRKVWAAMNRREE
jgi:soluble lytic murein transglycosylase-like protein